MSVARDGMKSGSSVLQRRKLKLKAKFESGPSHRSFKSIDPRAFNVGLIGSTCTALPYPRRPRRCR
jgi:hypothetical protein